MPMTTKIAQTHDKNQIRQLISDQMKAICTKDRDRIISYYITEAAVFELKPPAPIKNATVLGTFLSCSPASFGTEIRDLGTFVSGDMALAHWLWRFTDMEKDHPAMQAWIRNIAGYQRYQGKWRIVYEHCSLPFGPKTAVFSLES
jgi:ketosteroid isomerase-like protein